MVASRSRMFTMGKPSPHLLDGHWSDCFLSLQQSIDGKQDKLTLFWCFHKPTLKLSYSWKFQEALNTMHPERHTAWNWRRTSMDKSRPVKCGTSIYTRVSFKLVSNKAKWMSRVCVLSQKYHHAMLCGWHDSYWSKPIDDVIQELWNINYDLTNEGDLEGRLPWNKDWVIQQQ